MLEKFCKDWKEPLVGGNIKKTSSHESLTGINKGNHKIEIVIVGQKMIVEIGGRKEVPKRTLTCLKIGLWARK